MGKFVLSGEALKDLESVYDFIAKDNPDAADRVITSFYEVFNLIATQPKLGRTRQFRDKAYPHIRSLIVADFPNYIVFYFDQPKPVQILRVIHGARNVDELF